MNKWGASDNDEYTFQLKTEFPIALPCIAVTL